MVTAARDTEIYDQTVEIVRYYLGPAGKRYIDRQVKFHLKKSPKDLSAADLKQLLEWIRVSLALLTDDQTMVDEAVSKLKKVSS